MNKEKKVNDVARNIFRDLGNGGMSCVILHHFDFEEGGDIDFFADASKLDLFFLHLKAAVERAKWKIVQVFVHERSGAYIICRDSAGSGRFLFFDCCYDYRVRGHLILSGSELGENSHLLSWGGMGSGGLIELIYRFSKAGAKEKCPKKITKELKNLWESHRVPFSEWLWGRWGLKIEAWNEDSISAVLYQLGNRLAKQKWSIAELALKLKRLAKPRGLWVECPGETKSAIEIEIAPCFRKIMDREVSIKLILGSSLVLVGEGTTPGWKRKLLKLMGCWLQASSGEEVIQFLIARSARYQRWE